MRIPDLIPKLMLGLVLISMAACNQDQVLDTRVIDQLDIVNLSEPEVDRLASGQPTEEQFRQLANNGVKHVINLRAPEEMDWDEAGFVESLGMEYHAIPVAGVAGITSENAQALSRLLTQIGDEPVLVHCASANRVGALIAVDAREAKGMDVDAAIAEGQRWGLAALEPVVREQLTAN